MLLADNSTGRCVDKCPDIPDYYGYGNVCHYSCPNNGSILYAENYTRMCLNICPNNSFADSYTLRCVAVCTRIQYGYQGPSPVCLNKCPDPLYGENNTKICIEKCPNNTFGEN